MDLSSLRVCYFYKRAKQYNQIMSFDDLIRMYKSMIKIYSEEEANYFWNLIYININNRIFDSFSELNETIINCIKMFKKRPIQSIKLGKRKREE